MAASTLACRLFTGPHAEDGLHRCWLAYHNGFSNTQPTVWEDLVFAADGQSAVQAYDQKTGEIRWSRAVSPTRVMGADMVVGDSILVVPTSFEVVGLDAVTGTFRWFYEPPLDTLDPFAQPPKPGYLGATRIDSDSSTVYVPAWGASISALDFRTGQPRWIWRDDNPGGFRSGSMGVRVHGDTLYATVWHYVNQLGGQSEYWLVALSRATGAELWRKVFAPYTSGVSVEGRPVVFDNLVIFASTGGRIHAVDRFTQQLVWEYLPNTLHASLAEAELLDDVVYSDGGDGQIHALDARTGREIWGSNYGGSMLSDFLVTDRRIYVPSLDVYLYVLDRASGTRVASVADPSTGTAAEALWGAQGAYANGRVFFQVEKGVVCYEEP